jgi:carbonic anhydrase
MLASVSNRTIHNSMSMLSKLGQTMRITSSSLIQQEIRNFNMRPIPPKSDLDTTGEDQPKILKLWEREEAFDIEKLYRRPNYDESSDEMELEPPVFTTFDYSKNGANWTNICCGNHQTPINIVTQDCLPKNYKVKGKFYDIRGAEMIHSHNQLQVNYDHSEIELTKDDGEVSKWKSVQFHFHAPCEHTVDSKQHDVELHVVHKHETDHHRLCVIGIMFEMDKEAPKNEFITSLQLENLPNKRAKLTIRIADLLLDVVDERKFNYPGSLTIPPCSEGVEWLLVRETVKIPPYQVKLFSRLFADNVNFAGGKGNNREIQPLNGRTINII